MAAATSTTKLTVTLPNDVLDIVRAKVSSGEYADESEVVEAALIDLLLPPVSGEGVTDDWLRREVVPVIERMDADPTRGRTPEQVLERLRERHDRMRKSG
jgi:Arc/MetJ-type ribon-helix-helix transcriptional regulator